MAFERISAGALLRRADEFFMGEGPIYKTLRNLARRLSDEGIHYALAGGMALVFHGYRRETVDVDFLLTPEGRERLASNLEGRGYLPMFPGARKRFRDTETGVEIDLLVTGEYPGDGKPKPVHFPDPESASVEIEGIRVLTLEKIIELKLASGMTAPHRLRDLADVQELIKIRKLGADFAARLDPYVRDKYLELWNAVRLGEAYEADETR
ncbi:MAG TPA: nucleotidyltransferase family protein [Blastocatellia bacterium]|nr:nucleotidyltransferase family protein [Blastocatellia bacterium]